MYGCRSPMVCNLSARFFINQKRWEQCYNRSKNKMSTEKTKDLIDWYVKFREKIPPFNKNDEQEKASISESKENLNKLFSNDELVEVKKNICHSINETCEKINNIDSDCGIDEDFINQIYKNLYVSFSYYGWTSHTDASQIDIKSKIKKLLLSELLTNLLDNIPHKTTAAEVVDIIEDDFFKKLQQKFINPSN